MKESPLLVLRGASPGDTEWDHWPVINPHVLFDTNQWNVEHVGNINVIGTHDHRCYSTTAKFQSWFCFKRATPSSVRSAHCHLSSVSSEFRAFSEHRSHYHNRHIWTSVPLKIIAVIRTRTQSTAASCQSRQQIYRARHDGSLDPASLVWWRDIAFPYPFSEKSPSSRLKKYWIHRDLFRV